jgi:chromosome partitioning protein
MKLIKAQERIAGRVIPFAVLFTGTNPAVQPRTLRFIEAKFTEQGVPVLATRLYDREAFRALFSFGGTVAGLADRGVSNLAAAVTNAGEFAAEVIGRLRRPVREETA